jgi:5-methyltetrahydropteroyltriglutamate--homocysteine methyltransferase
VLGLVSTKSGVLEEKDALRRRVGEAAHYVAMEHLALSPQCGFASVETGNPISPEMQEKKLRLVVELAQDLWGSA